MLSLEPMTQPLRGEFPRAVPWKAERVGYRGSEQGISERIQHKREGAFRDMMFFMPNRELGDERSDRIEDWIQRVPIACNDHPGSKRSRALLPKCVETLIDDNPRVGFAGAGALDGFSNSSVHRFRDRSRQLSLQAGRRTEMMQEVGVRPPDLSGDGFQGHGLRTLFEQQLACRGQRGRAALFRSEPGPSY